MFTDYYQLLNIKSSASIDEIKRAYRLKAKTEHPDVNKNENATQLFTLINEAYENLIDSNKRAIYDVKYNYHHKKNYKAALDYDVINRSKSTKSTFNYDHVNFNKHRKQKDIKETHPFIYHTFFISGMFLGFILVTVPCLGVYLHVLTKWLLLLILPGFIMIVEGFNGLQGKSAKYKKGINWILKKISN